MSVYAVADLHGCLDLFKQIKDFLKPEDILYVLGDCGDRGPKGWELIKTVYEDPQCIYLKGNHEQMLVEAMQGNTYNCYQCGGKKTFKRWVREGAKSEWKHNLDTLPFYKEYINKDDLKIILTHAGFTPYEKHHIKEDELLWDRNHYYEPWEDDCDENVIIVHGHTPIPLMKRNLGFQNFDTLGACWYCIGQDNQPHKCNIDTGAYWLGYTVLLDLDTFDEHLFFNEDFKDDN